MARRKAGRGRSYHHGDLRAELIRAAAALASERGLAKLSLREVARRAGVSHAAPRHHFRTKEALLEAVAVEGFRDLDAALAEAQAAAKADPLAQLEALGVAYVRFAVANPDRFRAMFRASSTEPDLDPATGGPLRRLVSAVSACLARSPKPGADPLAAALVCWSAMHGLTALWLEGPIRRRRGRGPQRRVDAMAAYVAAVLAHWVETGAPPGNAPPVASWNL